VLGPMVEENFRRAMLLSRGHFSVFVERPISAGILGVIVVLLAAQAFFSLRARLRPNAAAAANIAFQE